MIKLTRRLRTRNKKRARDVTTLNPINLYNFRRMTNGEAATTPYLDGGLARCACGGGKGVLGKNEKKEGETNSLLRQERKT